MSCQLSVTLNFQCCQHYANVMSGRRYCKLHFEMLLQVGKMDLQEMGGGCGDWMEMAQDRDRWRALVSTVMNLRVR